MSRTIAAKFEVDWTGTDTWVDETAYLQSATGSAQLAPAASALFASRGTADTMTVTLFDNARRFNPLNSSGALYSAIQSGKAYHRPARFSIQVSGGSWIRVFTGVLKLPKEAGPTASEAGTVTFTVRSNDELLLNDRQSTTIANMALMAGEDEATIIEHWLDTAGVSTLDIECDPGLFQIPWSWLDDESVIEDCWQLASACGGRFYVDVEGQFCYENAYHWLTSPHTTSQQTYNRTTDYGKLTITLDDGDLFSDITVVAAARTAGPVGQLWAPDEPLVIPASTTKTVTATLRQPLAGAEGTLSYTAVTTGGVAVTSGLSVGKNWYAQRCILTIVNSNAFAVVLQQAAITGAQLVGGNQHEETAEYDNTFWTGRSRRVRRFTGNPYVQTPAQASALAEMMRDWSQAARLKYQLSNVVGNPSRKLGDLITIADSIMLAAGNRTAYITGLAWKWDSTGFTHTSIDCVDAATLYPYAATGYFVIGTSLLGAASKEVFY